MGFFLLLFSGLLRKEKGEDNSKINFLNVVGNSKEEPFQ